MCKPNRRREEPAGFLDRMNDLRVEVLTKSAQLGLSMRLFFLRY